MYAYMQLKLLIKDENYLPGTINTLASDNTEQQCARQSAYIYFHMDLMNTDYASSSMLFLINLVWQW